MCAVGHSLAGATLPFWNAVQHAAGPHTHVRARTPHTRTHVHTVKYIHVCTWRNVARVRVHCTSTHGGAHASLRVSLTLLPLVSLAHSSRARTPASIACTYVNTWYGMRRHACTHSPPFIAERARSLRRTRAPQHKQHHRLWGTPMRSSLARFASRVALLNFVDATCVCVCVSCVCIVCVCVHTETRTRTRAHLRGVLTVL